MGLCCSGVALDIVLLVCELVYLGKVEAKDIEGFEQQFGAEKKQPNTDMLMKYRRYRDDTCSVMKMETKEDVKNSVKVLGEAFLPDLDINVEVSIYVGAFLDVMFFKKFESGGYETIVKRKDNYPVTFCHATSNMSASIVKSIIGGEILRHRRLCSNDELAEVNDECIIQELISRGYQEQFVRKAVQKRKSQIEEIYDSEYRLKQLRNPPVGLVYGAKTLYDEEWFTHKKLMLVLKAALPDGVR